MSAIAISAFSRFPDLDDEAELLADRVIALAGDVNAICLACERARQPLEQATLDRAMARKAHELSDACVAFDYALRALAATGRAALADAIRGRKDRALAALEIAA